MNCPQCKGTLRRSKTRTFSERVIKQAMGYRAWRCRDCHWRGLMMGSRFADPSVAKRIVSLGLSVALILLITVVYFASSWVRQYFIQQRLSRPGIQKPVTPRQTGQLHSPSQAYCET